MRSRVASTLRSRRRRTGRYGANSGSRSTRRSTRCSGVSGSVAKSFTRAEHRSACSETKADAVQEVDRWGEVSLRNARGPARPTLPLRWRFGREHLDTLHEIPQDVAAGNPRRLRAAPRPRAPLRPACPRPSETRLAHSRSSCWSAVESAGWLTRSSSAACVTPPCSATAMTYWSTQRFMRWIHSLRLLKYENSVLDVAA